MTTAFDTIISPMGQKHLIRNYDKEAIGFKSQKSDLKSGRKLEGQKIGFCVFLFLISLFSLSILDAQNCIPSNNQIHTIKIPYNVISINGDSLPTGSEIFGLFQSADTLRCGGSITWTNQSTELKLYGAITNKTPGFLDGEQIKFRIRLPSGCIIENVDIKITFDSLSPNTDKFKKSGLSIIKKFEITPSNLNFNLPDYFKINCTKPSVLLKPTGSNLSNVKYEWYLNDSLISRENQINTGKGGFYTLIVSKKFCTNSQLILVEADTDSPLFEVGNPNDTITSCPGSKIQLFFNLTTDSIQSLRWNTGATTPEIEVDKSGSYTLTAIGKNGCKATDTLVVEYFKSPVVNLPDTINLCKDSVLVKLKGAGSIYYWSTSDSESDSIWVKDEGNLKVLVGNDNGCFTLDSTWVRSAPSPIFNIVDTLACEGLKIRLDVKSFGTTYKWSTGLTKSAIELDKAGTYSVKVGNKYGCITEDFFVLSYLPRPKINLKDTLYGCQGQPLTIDVTSSGISYQWNNGSKSGIIKVEDSGLYTVKVTNVVGCSQSDTTLVIFKTRAKSNWPSPLTACNGQTIIADGHNLPQPIYWSTGSKELMLQIAKAGLYSVSYVDKNGCQIIDSVRAIFYSNPSITLPDTFRICSGQTQTIDVRNFGKTYSWSTGSKEGIVTLKDEQLYRVTVTNDFGCQAKDSLRLLLWPSPIVKLTKSDTICPKESLGIDARSYGIKYKWNTGETTGLIAASTPGLYQVTVTNQYGCTGQGSTLVNALNYPKATVDQTNPFICLSDSLVLTGTGASPWRWLDPNKSSKLLTANRVRVKPTNTTKYGYVVQNRCGFDTAYSTVNVRKVKGSAGRDTAILAGHKIQLKATGGKSYQWISPKFPLSNEKIANPEVSPSDSTFFIVVIQDENNCRLRDTVNIGVYSDITELIKPINLFTPNGDGKNDVLKFNSLDLFKSNKITVFNRWGVIVYQKSGYQNDWGGTYDGSLLPAGIYFYVLEVDDAVLKNALTLIHN